MRKENRVLWKIILIVLCTVCLIWLIKKDRTDFQIKQPKGDGIRKEEAVVLLQAFLETLDEGTYRETDGNGGTGSDIIELQTWMQELKKEENLKENLAYGEYEKLLSGFPKETGNSTGQINQMKEKYNYAKKYKTDFYLLKEDFYSFYDGLVSAYGLETNIYRKEIDILAGKDSVQEEGFPEDGVLTGDGSVWKFRSPDFADTSFAKVTAYVVDEKDTDRRSLLTIYEKSKKELTLSGVWVMEMEEETVRFFYHGYEMVCSLGKEKGNTGLVREMLSDLTFQNGILQEMKQKKERVSGKLLRIDEKELELEGQGTLALSDTIKVYQLYEELREGTLEDLRIGYDFADFVLEDGKICGVLIVRKENMESIRVAIKNDGFASLYHDSLSFQADCDMELVYGAYGDRKKERIAEGTLLELKLDSDYFTGDRVELNPALQSGKIQICSLTRNQGTPVYRGRMEIAKTENGLLLINEVLLEEYLYSVVPSEMPASYPEEALKAQAVCARTYAYQYLLSPGLSEIGAHVDDSVGYQVYNNIAENSASTKAVKETTGTLLFHKEGLVSTYYYSTSCGFGADAGVWTEENKEKMPYLKAAHLSAKEQEEKAQALDMQQEENFRDYITEKQNGDFEAEEPWYRWNYEVKELDTKMLWEKLKARYEAAADKVLTFTGADEASLTELENSENYESREVTEFQKIYEIEVLKRREGGVIDALLIKTDQGIFKVVSEYNVRYVLSMGGEIVRQDGTTSEAGQLLPSAYFIINPVKEEDSVIGYTIIGGGYGHGVGMSQNAAKAMANLEMNWEEILSFFYENCEHKKMY